MAKYRDRLPQLASDLFMADGGLETELLFHDGRELPCFASFDLLKDAEGTGRLRRYDRQYAQTAVDKGLGLVLEAPTWRANRDWAARLGHDAAGLDAMNRAAIGLMLEIRDAFERPRSPMVISGNLGPRGDGYAPDGRTTADEAEAYHGEQIATFAQTAADLVSAFTMNYVEEAIGVARAARRHGVPAVLSFTLETDGRLPSGDTLAEAIERTDAQTGRYPAYYMINCAHPTHFDRILDAAAPWAERIRGVRANASCRSHA